MLLATSMDGGSLSQAVSRTSGAFPGRSSGFRPNDGNREQRAGDNE